MSRPRALFRTLGLGAAIAIGLGGRVALAQSSEVGDSRDVSRFRSNATMYFATRFEPSSWCRTCNSTPPTLLSDEQLRLNVAVQESRTSARWKHAAIGGLAGAALGAVVGARLGARHERIQCSNQPCSGPPLTSLYDGLAGGAAGMVLGGLAGWFWPTRE